MAAATFDVFASDLARFSVAVVQDACRAIGMQPRQQGEKAFPEIGALIAECERQERIRRGTQSSPEMEVYQCGRCDYRQASKVPRPCNACGSRTYQVTHTERFDLNEYWQQIRANPDDYFSVADAMRELAEKKGMKA